MAEKKKKSQVSLGVLFWIAFILLVLVIFLLNRPTITKLVRKFSSAVQGTEQTAEKPATTPEIQLPSRDPEPVQPLPTSTPEDANTAQEIEPKQPSPLDILPPETTAKTPTSDSHTSEAEKPQKTILPDITKIEQPKADVPVAMRSTSLYFVRIDSDGTIARKKVSRDLSKSDSPLVDTINTLLSGPNEKESNNGAVTLIPSGTRLLSATVKNGTAVLNFNDAFQFSEYGIEGAIGQLMQVVFTATEFSTVTNVQFLIEGQRKEYLGADGIKIGVPFSRKSFN